MATGWPLKVAEKVDTTTPADRKRAAGAAGPECSHSQGPCGPSVTCEMRLAFVYDILPLSRGLRLWMSGPATGGDRAAGIRQGPRAVYTGAARETGLDIVRRLGSHAVGLFDRAVMHVPIEIAQAAREEAQRLGADCCVAVGGGSTTGLGKAITLTSNLPILAIPTTYAGSEMTPIWGFTESRQKDHRA